MKNKPINVKLFIIILAILALIIGLTWALIEFVFTGEKEQTISLKALSFSYEEQENGLTITNTFPMSDEEGINSGNDFTFNVSGVSEVVRNINYYVYLEVDPTSTIDLSYVRFKLDNLTTDNNLIGSVNELSNKDTNEYYLMENALSFDGITTEVLHNYKLTIWISEGYANQTTNIDTETNKEQSTIVGGDIFKFKVSVATGVIPNLDQSGANYPELATGMIPVYYDSTNDVWKKADITNRSSVYQWYSYASSGTAKGMWANAVTVDVSNATIKDKYFNSDMSIKVANGTEVSMADINTMWVWIPRFNAVTPSNYNGGTKEAPGAIDVTFVNTSTSSIDAFWWDEDSDGIQDVGEQKSGFWYGKFETSSDIECAAENSSAVGSGCNLTTIKPKIIPNVTSWRGAQVATFFNTSRNMEATNNMYGFVGSEVDTHMSKNNEWGAVAYLTQSIYGRCSNSTTCTEVAINSCYSAKTGIGGNGVGDTCTTAVNQYNGAKGVLASTTGTIYGIYDMSGGSYDYVMGNYNNMSGRSIENNYNSGFNGVMDTGDPLTTGTPFPDSKYVNIYTNTIYIELNIRHALAETKGWYSDDFYNFFNSYYPWLTRGDSCGDTSSSGVFAFRSGFGNTNNNIGSRFALVK